ncbi:MAG: HDOD domain-containing protein [Gammaproteobacteria bacterium]|nr:HDOD domain-containing protein [Gammaproteobacteria bacterium]
MADCFIGRQPIFNRRDDVYAYELLYRSHLTDVAGDVDLDVATSQVIMNAFVEIGLDNIVGHRLAFINMTRQFLVTPELMCFPPEQVVLEIPGEVGADDEIRAAVNRLKVQGYTIALDGYHSAAPHAPLYPFTDIVKLDADDLDEATLRGELEKLAEQDVMVMAKRVATMEQRSQLAELGCDYFQGHYLASAKVMTAKSLPTNKMAILQLLAKISDPETDIEELENLISLDASLSLRVLRFVNSPLSGLTRKVDSIHQAVVYLGRDIIKNWVMLLTIANLDDVIPELVTTAFVRAKLCESLANECALDSKDSFFTVGMFSLVDAMMGVSTESLLESLPFSAEMERALLEQSGERGEALRCAQELEFGAPGGTHFRDVPAERIAQIYLESLQWADLTTATMH